MESVMRPPKFETAKILTIGDAMIDRYWHGVAKRISAEAPIPVVEVKEIEDRLGGAANVALNISTLGAESCLVAATGSDAAAKELKAKLNACSINATLVKDPLTPTTIKVRIVSQNQQIVRADFEEKFDISAESLVKAAKDFDAIDTVILSDYDKGVLADPQAFIKEYVSKKIPILVDPKHKDFSLYQGATLVKPNINELRYAIGEWNDEQEMIAKVRRLLQKFSWSAVLITRASDGMTLVEQATETHFPARTRDVYDTSGAGDTVISVLGASISSGFSLKDSVGLSNIAAGIVVGNFGVTSISGPEIREEVSLIEKKAYNRGGMSLEQLISAVRDSKAKGERIVFTNGCFDILHAGHVSYLEEAKKEGDKLIVGLNSDESVARMKGKGRPINAIDRRMKIIASLKVVDWVVCFDEDTPESLIETISPHVLVKGGDYSVDQVLGADHVRTSGGVVKVLSFVEDCSTSMLVEKIREL